MDAVKWIQEDLARGRRTSQAIKTLFLIGVFLLPMMLGIGLREGREGVFELRTFLPNLFAAAFLALAFLSAYRSNFSARVAFALGISLLVFCAFLAGERVLFPVGERTTYPSGQIFWHENLKCFTKGGFTTLIMGLYLILLSFVTSSWPSRRWRFFIAVLSGIAGMVMLGFHCDSSSPGHVFFGHFGQGVVVGAAVFLLQELIFRFQVKRAFPDLMKKIKNGGSLS